ncbi:hypothetical protein [Azoarcus sp. KH32C]|uniref:hypothetical protein n=1 Tax=Azoarcus sp. KH32C TaxID=748247 RepID=UPI0002385FE8|nr:hypothetical protein [Azoarcus sp. KH32C]BAL24018.1 hypothetical protein AZKH_1703 [Azoarcus sp. KH32C]
MKLATLAMSAALLVSAPVSADTVREAALAGELQQFTTDGKVSACGVTISAIELVKTRPAPGDKLLVFNGSFMLYSLSGGLVKGRASEVQGADFLAGKPNLHPREAAAYWLKAQGKPATSPAPGQGMQPSDDPAYKVYVTEFEPLSLGSWRQCSLNSRFR